MGGLVFYRCYRLTSDMGVFYMRVEILLIVFLPILSLCGCSEEDETPLTETRDSSFKEATVLQERVCA